MVTEDDDFDIVRNFDGQVRNYANNYNAYNSDTSDIDLKSYSEEVQETENNRAVPFLTALAMLLMAGILGILAWWLIQFRGLL